MVNTMIFPGGASRKRRSSRAVSRSTAMGTPLDMQHSTTARPSSAMRRDLPTLVFVNRKHCGASRRMESLVAWIKVTQKKRLRVVDLDADRSPELVHHLDVREVPSLVVLEDGRVVDRLEGRATGRQIDELIRPHLQV
jgi:thioredoxin-like negative regulator of GroEL